MYLKPSKIFYSQDSINNRFDKQCRHAGIRIGDTLDDICEGRCSVSAIPTIKVVQRDNRWVTCDNRRLWVFRHLERLGKCEEVPVQVTPYIPDAKLTSCNGGKDIEVRRGPGGRWHSKPSKRQAASPKPKTISANRKVYSSETPSTRNFNDPIPSRSLNVLENQLNYSTSSATPAPYAGSSIKTYGYNFSSGRTESHYNTYNSGANLPAQRSSHVIPTGYPSSNVADAHAQEEKNRRGIYGVHTAQKRSTGYQTTTQHAYGSDRSTANLHGRPVASRAMPDTSAMTSSNIHGRSDASYGMPNTSAMTSQPTSRSPVTPRIQNNRSYSDNSLAGSTRRQASSASGRIVDDDDITIHDGTDRSVSAKSTSTLQRQRENRISDYEQDKCCACTIL